MPSSRDDAQSKIGVDISDRHAYDAALRDLYHPQYHSKKAAHGELAAERILPLVFSIVDVNSLIDVGCGPGSWLSVARRLGVSELTGVEGEWAAEWFSDEQSLTNDLELIFANLEDELTPTRTFDLAVCIEVIEHLSPARGESFVRDLCRLAPHVLLAAAVPDQGGNNHINERWPSYWAQCFAAHGFRPLDVVRPQVWGDDDLLVHHRQNPILFVHEDAYAAALARSALLSPPPLATLDKVHPVAYWNRSNELRAASRLGLRRRIRIAASIPRAAFQRLRRTFRR